MPTKTRKRKITGALGKGAQGTVYNARSSTLYTELARIVSIELYTTTTNVLLDNPHPFLTFLRLQPDIIVKTLKNKQSFLDELHENRIIIRCYKGQASKYLTIAPLKGFRSLQITGALAKRRDGSEIYLIFGIRCDNQFDVRIDQLLVDLLESLAVLQKAEYLHNDIKLDNVVLCESRYKLIDWGLSSPYDPYKIGNRVGTHPIKWYMRGVPPAICVRILKLRIRMIHPSFSYSSLYSEVYNQIQREFKEVIRKPFSYEQLLATYAPTFDVFMVGMMLLVAIHTHSLDEARYLPIVKALVSLKKPLTATKALAICDRQR